MAAGRLSSTSTSLVDAFLLCTSRMRWDSFGLFSVESTPHAGAFPDTWIRSTNCVQSRQARRHYDALARPTLFISELLANTRSNSDRRSWTGSSLARVKTCRGTIRQAGTPT